MRIFYLGAALLPPLFSSVAFAAAYPPDAVRGFINGCVGYNKELVPACTCIIREVQKSVPYKEYEALIQSGNALKDKRISAIADNCAKAQ